METAEGFKYFGLYVFLILVLGLIFVLYKWPADKHLTFSQRVALQRQSIICYAILFILTLPPLLLFFIGWFVPNFYISSWFAILITISSVTQLLATLIPETRGWKVTVHRFIAGFSAVILVPTLAILLTASTLSLVKQFVVLIGILIMSSVIARLMVTQKEVLAPSFIHQSIYYAGFFVPILVISYL